MGNCGKLTLQGGARLGSLLGIQNVFIERFIRQNEEMRQKMRPHLHLHVRCQGQYDIQVRLSMAMERPIIENKKDSEEQPPLSPSCLHKK